jgi:hypothetical protein
MSGAWVRAVVCVPCAVEWSRDARTGKAPARKARNILRRLSPASAPSVPPHADLY